MAEVALETVQIDEKIDVGFYERFKSLPLITQALSQTGTIYNKVKESNGLTQYACNAGENVVKTVATKAYNVGTPIAGMALRIAEPYVGNPGLFGKMNCSFLGLKNEIVIFVFVQSIMFLVNI